MNPCYYKSLVNYQMKFEARLYTTHLITIVLRFIDTHNIFDDF